MKRCGMSSLHQIGCVLVDVIGEDVAVIGELA
jgi:hypothetical protein